MKPLDKPPAVEEGDDQAARTQEELEVVTVVDFEDADPLDDDEDYEDEPDA